MTLAAHAVPDERYAPSVARELAKEVREQGRWDSFLKP